MKVNVECVRVLAWGRVRGSIEGIEGLKSTYLIDHGLGESLTHIEGWLGCRFGEGSWAGVGVVEARRAWEHRFVAASPALWGWSGNGEGGGRRAERSSRNSSSSWTGEGRGGRDRRSRRSRRGQGGDKFCVLEARGRAGGALSCAWVRG